jgi:glycosyltransferase involved in cell wall biosynthesis
MEAIDSVLADPVAANWEIIVVDDGSTDAFTIAQWPQVKEKVSRLIHQTNQGLAAARNAGIAVATAPYVLPLDADNTLVPSVFAHALAMMQADDELAMVYTDHLKFGTEGEQRISVGPASLPRLLAINTIDACSLIRKEVLEALGGYDAAMPAMGHEDWDLVVHLLIKGYRLHYLPETGFHYRLHHQSMFQNITQPATEKNRAYLFQKYAAALPANYVLLYDQLRQQEQQNSFANHRQQEWKKYLKQHPWKSALKVMLGRDFG